MNFSFKKLITLVLTASMALSLAACGSSTESGTGSSAGSAAATATPAAASATPDAEAPAVPEFSYEADFSTVSAADASYLTGQVYTDDGFYATGSAIVGSIAPEGVEASYYGEYDITEPRIYFVSNDGKAEVLSDFAPIAAPEAPEGSYDYDSDSYIDGVARNSKGNLVTFEVVYTYWNDVEDLTWESADYSDHHFYQQTCYTRELDSTGAELSRAELTCSNNEYMYSPCVLDAQDNLLVIHSTESGEYTLRAINAAGETVYEIPTDDSISSVFTDSTSTLYVMLWGAGLQIAPVDAEAHTLGTAVDIPGDAYTIYTGGGDYPLYYTSGVYFYGLDPATGESTRLFNWLDCDINPDYLSSVNVRSDGSIQAFVTEFDSADMAYTYYMATVEKRPYDPSTQKTELTLATQYLSSATRDAVISFNRSSKTTRIVVKDYSEYNTEDDYSAGLTKLTTEIMAGNCPDLIDMNGISASQLASKGLLEDLYPYMDADADLNRDDYFANVLAAAEQDGKLVSTVSYFTIDTVVGASSVVGDEPGWTYSELELALNDMPDGCTAFDISTTRDTVLSKCLSLDMDSFVNWETGEVTFDTEAFTDLLEFANTFPATYDWETYSYDTDAPEVRIAQGEQMLYSTTLSDLESLMYIESCFRGTPVTFIGYPTASGTGNTIAVDPGFAMSSTCKDKDAAWQFLRTFFTEKYYKNNVYYGLPAQKSLLAKQLNDLTSVHYSIDGSGNYRLDANGEKIPEERYFAVGSNIYTAYCLSADLAERFETLLETTTKTAVEDDAVSGIVTELAEAYFAGQKSAEETARLIQSKANIYVNEQR